MKEMSAETLGAPSVRFCLGTNNLGRDLLSRVILGDPRLRGGAGRYGVRVKKEALAKSEPSSPEGLTK